MPSRWFIINEWLLHDLLGDNKSESQKQSVQILNSFTHEPHGIVILQDSPWMSKAWQLMKMTDPLQRKISQFLHLSILRDANKCRIIKEDEVEKLPDSLQQLLTNSQIDNDDEYLLQTWCSSPVKIECIVTTDKNLMRALDEHYPEIRTIHRDEFLDSYPEVLPSD
ncbi:MAG: hypothetical protein OXG02_05865 [Chloroflexi bacterium]|nr:hypothetical protein [Chloroflexota bacterium]MCY4010204.1 hypothetical protein [Anaerolineaceae bacterium]MCY4106215.1 hypothetical protein [Chloroflexota bacterium]